MRKRKNDRMDNDVWDVLEEVIREHPVLLNRAPYIAQTWNPSFRTCIG